MTFPTALSGLTNWYRADTIALTNGSSIATWKDLSGNGNDLTQATGANQPTYKTSSVGGRPGVNFNGSQNMSGTGITGDTFTVFCVFSSTNGSGITFSNGNANGWALQLFSGRDLTYLVVSDNSAGSYTNNTPEIWCGNRATGTNGAGNLYLNGTNVVNTTGTISSATAQVFVGNKYNSLAAYTGDIAEMIQYNRVLSPSEQTGIETYLARRYGIQVSDGTSEPGNIGSYIQVADGMSRSEVAS